MDRLKKVCRKRSGFSLQGSSIIEVLVASLVFLLIFCITMETLTRIASVRHDESMLSVEKDLQDTVHEFSVRSFTEGEHTRTYDWGEIDIEIKPYNELPGIHFVTFTARAGKQHIRHRILTFFEDEL